MPLYNLLKYSRGNYILHYGRFSFSLHCCAWGSSPLIYFPVTQIAAPSYWAGTFQEPHWLPPLGADVTHCSGCARPTHLGLRERRHWADSLQWHQKEARTQQSPGMCHWSRCLAIGHRCILAPAVLCYRHHTLLPSGTLPISPAEEQPANCSTLLPCRTLFSLEVNIKFQIIFFFPFF